MLTKQQKANRAILEAAGHPAFVGSDAAWMAHGFAVTKGPRGGLIATHLSTGKEYRYRERDSDPTPYCHICGAKSAAKCDCGPYARNH